MERYAGVMLLGDFNTLNDKSLRAYPLKQLLYKSVGLHVVKQRKIKYIPT